MSFMGLPLEVRQIILSFALPAGQNYIPTAIPNLNSQPTTYIPTRGAFWKTNMDVESLHILHTSRVLHREALPVFWKQNRLIVSHHQTMSRIFGLFLVGNGAYIRDAELFFNQFAVEQDRARWLNDYWGRQIARLNNLRMLKLTIFVPDDSLCYVSSMLCEVMSQMEKLAEVVITMYHMGKRTDISCKAIPGTMWVDSFVKSLQAHS